MTSIYSLTGTVNLDDGTCVRYRITHAGGVDIEADNAPHLAVETVRTIAIALLDAELLTEDDDQS